MTLGVEAGASGDGLTERVARGEGGQTEGASVDSKVEIETDGRETGMVFKDGSRGGTEGSCDDFGCESLYLAEFVGDTNRSKVSSRVVGMRAHRFIPGHKSI